MLQEHCYLTSIIGFPVVTENFIVCVKQLLSLLRCTQLWKYLTTAAVMLQKGIQMQEK